MTEIVKTTKLSNTLTVTEFEDDTFWIEKFCKEGVCVEHIELSRDDFELVAGMYYFDNEVR